MQNWLRQRLTEYVPGVGRVFICCDECRRVIPHYTVSGRHGRLRCDCGGTVFRAATLPEWRAAWWVLAVGLLWRKTLRRRADWDPRVPLRLVSSRYA